MHWAALGGAARDPYVLARLGLYPFAMAAQASDAKGRRGRALAAAALGKADGKAMEALAALRGNSRKLAARLVALHDCETALELLEPGDHTGLAACLLALDRPEDARGHLGQAGENSREAAAIRAHIEICAGEWGAAREALNAMFGHDDLGAPLASGSGAFTIDTLRGETPPVSEGPKVSVVIPYHNAAGTIETAIASITGQSWRNVEILAVDDRSDDESPAIVRRLADSDGRIVLLANVREPGVYGARNTAIAAATGEYVTFLDADDWSPGERLARQIAALGSGTVAIANHIRMDDAGRPVAPRIFPLVRPVPITMALRRETLVAAGPFDAVATGADSEMFARLEMLHGKAAVARDPAVLLVARWRSGSLSRNREGGLLGLERYRYRAQWMFRHAGLESPRLPEEPGAA
ncbi:glycosyl transferase family 2 [Parasphingopyxis lamellibrachiae]|uniref:Glycosyl transferase family 2 n=2 Tax=Parasphingopyxis lamellibrachiae TaxID=680125 RepID=A0A3D9FDY6_9SPHN|nr:glycosyl transferase family 2 [Parasphingopyxis lamellibrachiae]